MKKLTKFIGIVALTMVIGFSITACAGFADWWNTPSEPRENRAVESGAGESVSIETGTITLTGLDEYNGLFAYVTGMGDNEKEIVGAVIFNESFDMMIPRSFTGGRIANGSVTMPVWQVDSYELNEEDYTYDFTYVRYSGSGGSDVVVMIWEEDEVYLGRFSFPSADGFASVTFNNGIGQGTANISDGDDKDDYGLYER
jgi:hypothetical protein